MAAAARGSRSASVEVSFKIRKLGVNLYNYYAKGVEKYENGIFSKSIEDLKLVAHEATRGLQMAPNFNGTLSCCKLKMISGVLLESSAEIDGNFYKFEI